MVRLLPDSPGCPTEAVVETLRFFLREGVQWRELRATGDRVCGATLRRRLMEWSAVALLRRVHAALVRMVRSGPEAAAAAWDVVPGRLCLGGCGRQLQRARQARRRADRAEPDRQGQARHQVSCRRGE